MIRRPWVVLTLLTGLNLLNYLDRLVVAAILPKIKDELGFSDTVAGALATIFLLGYMLTSPIFGRLGDRISRKGLITLGILAWSAATIASGLATTTTSLILARACVGVGEASYATLAPTIIDDITPSDRKGRALAIFFLATPVGGALGYLVGGFLEARWGWRSAFFFAGGPGMILAFTCLFIAEPARKATTDKPNVLRDLRALYTRKLYVKGVIGYCAQTAAIGAFSHWAPTFLYRTFSLPLAKANFLFGIITVVAGAIGTVIGGRVADRQRAKLAGADADPSSPASLRILLRICAIGSFVGGPAALAAFLAPSPAVFFVLVFVAIAFLFSVTSPINAIVLSSVPTELRASAMALTIFAIHFLGDLWSPTAVGWLSTQFSIRLAMLALPVAIAISALLWWPGRSTGASEGTPARPA